eukprot:TRINITY_DN1701_c0_g2_i1.p1 TRINITY_DN1701_c0_g2~~TRINITY_DN1701_c0_g2_i1.p1  ORF type:complete len:399 (+),score=133.23 TRINITY_DN1701_c0_g2_i1:77-1198(+)
MPEVHLYMYDISKGMARALSPMMLGREIEAIWHTSVVVYDREYLFSGGVGILDEAPETTPFGLPLHKKRISTTSKTQSEFRAWNRTQAAAFGPDSYNLLQKNCNHYSDAALRFLTGEGVPDTVSGMMGSIVNSPLGRIAVQFLDGVQQQLTQQMQQQQSGGQTTSAAAPASAPARSSPLDGSGGTSAPTSLLGAQQQQQRAAPGPKYFCHMCDKEVRVTGADPKCCAECKGEFIEVLEEEPAPQQWQQQARSSTSSAPAGEPIHPLGAILQALAGPQGSNLEPLVSGITRGIQRLLQEPANDSSRRMNDDEINRLRTGTVRSQNVGEECAICHECFVASTSATTLPCDHVFHSECIRQWLRLRNNCPTCRHDV